MPFLWISIIILLIWLLLRWSTRHSIRLALNEKVFSNKLQVLLGFGSILTTKVIISEFAKIATHYGKHALIYLGPYPYFLTSDPNTIKDILTSKLCVNKASIPYRGMKYVITNGLITKEGEEWAKHRKILNPSFKNANLMKFMPTFNKRVKEIFTDIDEDIETGKNSLLLLFFRQFSLHISVETIIARDAYGTHYDVPDYAKRVACGLEYLANVAFNFIYWNGLVRRLANITIFKKSVEAIEILTGVIIETLDNYQTMRGRDSSYLKNVDSVMDYMDRARQRNEVNRDDVIATIFHMFVGSFETTSSTVYFTLILLAMHPEYQELAYAEICDVFPDDDDGEFEVTSEHIGQMVYLDMILNESLRILPTVPHTGRRVVGGDLKLSNGVVLAEGQNILIDIYSLHRSTEIWGPDAHKFNPDNFLSCNTKSRHPYAFIPFTKGIRYCVGMRYAELSIKVALARLIKRYQFSTTATLDELAIENQISSQLAKHPPMTVVRRKIQKNK